MNTLSTGERHIQDVAFNLFRSHGVKSVTMDDIAREAGVSKKTIYQRYENKEELVIAALRDKFEQNRIRIGEILRAEDNPVKKIIDLYHFTLKSIHSYSLAFFHGIKKYHPKAQALCTAYLKSVIFNEIGTLLREAKEKKMIREDIDVDMVSTMYFWGVEEFSNGAFSEQINRDFNVFFRHFILNNIRGMLTDEYLDLVTF